MCVCVCYSLIGSSDDQFILTLTTSIDPDPETATVMRVDEFEERGNAPDVRSSPVVDLQLGFDAHERLTVAR